MRYPVYFDKYHYLYYELRYPRCPPIEHGRIPEFYRTLCLKKKMASDLKQLLYGVYT